MKNKYVILKKEKKVSNFLDKLQKIDNEKYKGLISSHYLPIVKSDLPKALNYITTLNLHECERCGADIINSDIVYHGNKIVCEVCDEEIKKEVCNIFDVINEFIFNSDFTALTKLNNYLNG